MSDQRGFINFLKPRAPLDGFARASYELFPFFFRTSNFFPPLPDIFCKDSFCFVIDSMK